MQHLLSLLFLWGADMHKASLTLRPDLCSPSCARSQGLPVQAVCCTGPPAGNVWPCLQDRGAGHWLH